MMDMKMHTKEELMMMSMEDLVKMIMDMQAMMMKMKEAGKCEGGKCEGGKCTGEAKM